MAKGAYDIGRKALYLVLVVIILIIAFIYMDVAIGNFRIKTSQHIGELERFILFQKIVGCLSKEDYGILQRQEIDTQKLGNFDNCFHTEKSMKIYIKNKQGEVLWQAPFPDLNRVQWKDKHLVLYNNQLAVLEMNM